ncbi:MAG: hypothetical protein ICV69_05370 [Thermoleophilaceae bacterium]|nr:hypothetical protein [Thermoleophilaceae bacterium]
MIEWARRRGSAAIFSAASHLRAVAWFRRGALDEAEADAANARRHVTLQEVPYGTLALAMTLVERGQAQAADSLWREQSLDDGGTESIGAIVQRHARARVRAALGRRDEALADLRHCGRLEHDWGLRSSCYANWRADAARLLAAAGRSEEARALAAEELERARSFGSERALERRCPWPAWRRAAPRASGSSRRPRTCWPRLPHGSSTQARSPIWDPRCVGRAGALPPETGWRRPWSWPASTAPTCSPTGQTTS